MTVYTGQCFPMSLKSVGSEKFLQLELEMKTTEQNILLLALVINAQTHQHIALCYYGYYLYQLGIILHDCKQEDLKWILLVVYLTNSSVIISKALFGHCYTTSIHGNRKLYFESLLMVVRVTSSQLGSPMITSFWSTVLVSSTNLATLKHLFSTLSPHFIFRQMYYI